MDRLERIKADGLTEQPIEFYRPRDPYGFMSSFSGHKVVLLHPFRPEMVEHDTGEHRFQAMKSTNEEDYDRIVAAPTASDAKELGGSILLRDGWGNSYGDLCWFAMVETVLAKTLQHAEIRRQLLATGNRPIWESSPVDDIWGIRFREDYRGKNLLGRSWMYARSVQRGFLPQK